MQYDDEPNEENNFSFELLNSPDGLIITLVCCSTQELSPDEYAEALKAFADRICALTSMSEVETDTLN
jgi:hypothetical protein